MLKRLLKWSGSLLLTIILAFSFSFILSNFSSSDPIDYSLRSTDPFFEFDAISYQQKYSARATMMGLDKPNFYFSWIPLHLKNKNYYKLSIPQQDFFLFWSQKIANPAHFDRFYIEILQLKHLEPQSDVHLKIWEARTLSEVQNDVGRLSSDDDLLNFVNNLEINSRSKLPHLSWNGFNNIYHDQLVKVFRWSTSYSTYFLKPVAEILPRYLMFTLFISIFSLIILILLSFVFVEILSGLKKYWQSVILGFFDWIYAMPVFWMATLAVIAGTYMYVNNLTGFLGSPGIFIVRPQDSVFTEIYNNIGNLMWPILVIVLNGLAYFISYIQSILRDEQRKVYVQAFLMRGFTYRQIYTNFLRRRVIYSITALLPTIFASLIAGSVVLEVIFNIPGMGSLLYSSIKNYDWNMVHIIIIFTSVLIWIGNEFSNYLQNKLMPQK